MARFSNFNMYGGSMSSCNINGRNITVMGDDVYVDGILYVPANGQGDIASGPFKPGKMVDHTFDVSSKFSLKPKDLLTLCSNNRIKPRILVSEGIFQKI